MHSLFIWVSVIFYDIFFEFLPSQAVFETSCQNQRTKLSSSCLPAFVPLAEKHTFSIKCVEYEWQLYICMLQIAN